LNDDIEVYIGDPDENGHICSKLNSSNDEEYACSIPMSCHNL